MINKPVIVEWEDITTDHGWRDLEQALAVETVKVRSIGWVLKKDNRHMWLAATITEDGTYNDITKIPKGCILNVAYLPG